MKVLLFLSLITASYSVFSSEDCAVGYTCEYAANGDYIVRQTRLIKDESIQQCLVETIINVGPNEGVCDQIAADLNYSL